MNLKNKSSVLTILILMVFQLFLISGCGDNSTLIKQSLEPDINVPFENTPAPTTATGGGGSNLQTGSGLKMKTQISNQFSTSKVCNSASGLCMSAGIVR